MNYRTVASFANEEKLLNDFKVLLEGPKAKTIKNAHCIAIIYGLSQFAIYGQIALLFYAGAYILKNFHDDGEMPINIFISIFAMNFGALAAGQANQFGPDMSKAKIAAKKIFGIIEKPTEITAMSQGSNMVPIDMAKFEGNIEFHNVWFRYPTRKNDWVLKGLNLKINKNETVALVGESGCGKSTIASLILRLYHVNHGKITIDGVDIRDYNLKQLRHAMGLVMQEPTLFNYSILENILYGEANATNS